MTDPTPAPAAAAPAQTSAPSCDAAAADAALVARLDALDKKLHELAHAVAQDGNMHPAGEDRVHALFAEGFLEHFEYERPKPAVNDPDQGEQQDRLGKPAPKESAVQELLRTLGLDTPEKIAALASAIKATPGELKRVA